MRSYSVIFKILSAMCAAGPAKDSRLRTLPRKNRHAATCPQHPTLRAPTGHRQYQPMILLTPAGYNKINNYCLILVLFLSFINLNLCSLPA